jgi:hypothetical protein
MINSVCKQTYVKCYERCLCDTDMNIRTLGIHVTLIFAKQIKFL